MYPAGSPAYTTSPSSSMELECIAWVMVTLKSPTCCEPPLFMGEMSFSKPLPPSHKQVSKFAISLGRNSFAIATRSPRWSECAWVRKIASTRASFFRFSGQRGLVFIQGSMSATWPEGVVTEKVLWPKYAMRLPFKSSIKYLSKLELPEKAKTNVGSEQYP